MNIFPTHVLINNTDNGTHDLRRFILDGLSDFDKMKVVLEQAMYSIYLKTVCGESIITADLDKTVTTYYRYLKTRINTTNQVENALYDIGMTAIKSLLGFSAVPSVPSRVTCNYEGLLAIFSKENTQTYYGNLYTASMTKVFFDIWYNMVIGWYNAEEYPDGIMYDTALYYPQVTTMYGAHQINKVVEQRILITLTPIAINKMYFKPNGMCGLTCLLSRYDLSEYTIDKLIAIIANFSIDHSRYVMTASGAKFVDVCFDMVTGSSFTTNYAGNDKCEDRSVWIETLRDMILKGQLQSDIDGELFGELLARIGENSDLVNYFKKPITVVSATEALAFRGSVFAEFLPDKIEAGLEAMDEKDQDSDESDNENDSTGEDADAETSNDDTSADTGDDTETTPDEGSTDTAETTTPEPEKKDQSAEKVRPQIDPGKMLLELANPTDSMSDYIYRETVSRRIASILKNPPENAMPNDLLMLKRWRSRWLYLASIACLRDFLTRVSLRISNV